MNKKSIIIALLFGFVAIQTQAQQVRHQFLLFWRSNCSGCHDAIPHLVKKVAQLDTSLFTIKAISFDTDSVSYFRAIEELNMRKFVHIYDFKAGYHNNTLARKYAVTKTPTLLYINNEGEVLAVGNQAFKLFNSFIK